MKRLLILFTLFALGACAYVDPSITQQTKIYSDAKIHKSQVVMTAQPRTRQYQPLTAVFIPFFVQEPTTEYRQLGRELGGVFYSAWRERQLFPIFEYASNERYRGRGRAISLARAKGADLVVVGFIPHFYSGSTVGDSEISLQIQIYETRTGMLLFDMAQAGRVEFRGNEDWIMFSKRTRMPDSPLYAMIRSIAADMAIPVQSWTPRAGADYAFADNSAGIVNAMTAPAPPRAEPTPETSGNNAALSPEASIMEKDLKGEKETAGGGVNLDIHFAVDKDTINKESYPLLDSLAEALTSPQLKGKEVVIAGHTDSDAPDLYNLGLSKRRAEAVKDYLVKKHNIEPGTLITVGYGESRPLAPNDSPANKQRNRRVEVRLAQ